MRDGISLFSCDAKTSSLLKSCAWVWVGWGVGWFGKVIPIHILTTLCGCALCQNLHLSFHVSLCLELYLPISRTVLLFMVVTSSRMLLGPSSTELCFIFSLQRQLHAIIFLTWGTCRGAVREFMAGQGFLSRPVIFYKKSPQLAKQIQLFGLTQTQTWNSHCTLCSSRSGKTP